MTPSIQSVNGDAPVLAVRGMEVGNAAGAEFVESVPGTPLLLISDDDGRDRWDTFIRYASTGWQIHVAAGPTAYATIQAVWQIGEPSVVCAIGSAAGEVALKAQAAAPGAIPLAVLVDFRSSDPSASWRDSPGRVAIVRGRQSEVATHEDSVAARAAIGARCELIELEDCGNNAAESCTAAFESALRWLAIRE